MVDLTRNHYMIYRQCVDGLPQLTACYETSNGAVAHMAETDIWYRIEVHPRSWCPRCTPFWDREWRRLANAATSSEATPTRPTVARGREHADYRGVYDKQAPGHTHHCTCGTVRWRTCYRADCGGDGSARWCPWHTLCKPDVTQAVVRVMNERYPGWADEVAAELGISQPQ